MKRTDKTGRGSSRWLGAVFGLALVGLVAVTIARRGASPPEGGVDRQVQETNGPARTSEPESPFRRLQGRWLRPDGGYVLDVRWPGSDGGVEVSYLNPRPIHVSRAEAFKDDDGIKLLVELQDVGYPGCVYTLRYDPEQDRMEGTYYQAAVQETFQVEFTRLD